MNKLAQLNEFKRREYQRETDKPTIDRSKKVPYCRYRGITKNGTVYFDVRSASGNGYYTVKFRLVDLPDVIDDPDLTPQEKVRLALDGDINVYCSCPAYRYWGFEYINTQLGSNEGDPQERFPHVRNPKLTGILCKHIYKAFSVLPMNWTSIASDIQKGKFLEVR